MAVAKTGKTAPYPPEICDFVVKMSETHTMPLIVDLVKKKKDFSLADRKRFSVHAGYKMVGDARRAGNGNGKAAVEVQTTPTNGKRKGKRKRKFDGKVILGEGTVVLEMQPGQLLEYTGDAYAIKSKR